MGEVELAPGLRAVRLPHRYLLQLILALDLLKVRRFEIFEDFSPGIVSVRMQNPMRALDHNPRYHPRVAARDWRRIDAFQDAAGFVVRYHISLQQPLLWPVEKLQPQVRDPEI